MLSGYYVISLSLFNRLGQEIVSFSHFLFHAKTPNMSKNDDFSHYSRIRAVVENSTVKVGGLKIRRDGGQGLSFLDATDMVYITGLHKRTVICRAATFRAHAPRFGFIGGIHH